MMLVLAQVTPRVESALLEHGVLGLMCLILLGVAVVLWRENRALHAARTADQQAFTAKIVEVQMQTVAALTTSNAALEAQRESSEKVFEGLRDLGEEFRRPKR